MVAVAAVAPRTILSFSGFFGAGIQDAGGLGLRDRQGRHASKDDLVKARPVFRGFDQARMTGDIGVLWHPGAVKFSQEIKQWPPKG